MNQLLSVLKALVIDQKGPLVDGQIDRAKRYARETAAKLSQATK